MPAVVAGGASSLSLASARLLASKGERLFISDVIERSGRFTADAIGPVFCTPNLTDEASVRVGLQSDEAADSSTRTLVNFAGIIPRINHPAVGRLTFGDINSRLGMRATCALVGELA